jgi:hypothetical protein
MQPSRLLPATIAALSTQPLGGDIARRLAVALIEASQIPDHSFEGALVANSHRDYCGHGLLHQDGKFLLAEVFDGFLQHEKPIHTWDSINAFVECFAVQSDFTLAGLDPQSPVFYTTDNFSRNNQRLTELIIRGFVISKGHKNFDL